MQHAIANGHDAATRLHSFNGQTDAQLTNAKTHQPRYHRPANGNIHQISKQPVNAESK